MNTITKTYMICPHCGENSGSTIDHLDPYEFKVGTWFCERCGGGFNLHRSVVRGPWTAVATAARMTSTLDLLRLDGKHDPVFFVVRGRDFGGPDPENSKRFFYEEHSCPTNWIGDTLMISTEGDHDPHGFLRYVRSVDCPTQDREEGIEDEAILELFPELVGSTGSVQGVGTIGHVSRSTDMQGYIEWVGQRAPTGTPLYARPTTLKRLSPEQIERARKDLGTGVHGKLFERIARAVESASAAHNGFGVE